MAVSSPIVTSPIRKSMEGFGSSLMMIRNTVSSTIKVLQEKNSRKKKSIRTNINLFQRSREAKRRKNTEELLEANSLAQRNIARDPNSALKNASRGFLGRIMDFLGSLLIGWALNNLPTFIFMGREFINRVQNLVSIGTDFIRSLGAGFLSFGKLLGAIGQNIIKFDFADKENKVSSALDDLRNVFDDMKFQIEDGIKNVTTPLNINIDTGEQAPPFGTQYPAEPELQGTPSTGAFTGTGTTKGAQIAKRLQRDLGITDYQAAGVVGNLIEENTTLNPDRLEGPGIQRGLLVDAMRRGIGYGWAQWTDPGRQRNLYNYAKSRGINPDTQPLTDEINYGFLVEELKSYRNGLSRTRSLEEASTYILKQYERPLDQGPAEQQQRINASKRVLQLIPTAQIQTTQQVIQGRPQNAPQLNLNQRYYKNQNVAGQIGKGVITSLYRSANRPNHNGIDIGAPEGTYIALKVDCVIIDYGNTNPTGYGNEMHVWIPQYQIRLKFAHLLGAIVTSGTVPAGKSFARVGSTGRSDGPHIHLEAGPRNQYKGDRDPSPYVSLLWLTDRPSAAWARTAVTQTQTQQRNVAQVSAQPRTQQTQQLAQQIRPERRGNTVLLMPQQIVASQPMQAQPQQIQKPSNAASFSIAMQQTSLNRNITNNILLSLSYT